MSAPETPMLDDALLDEETRRDVLQALALGASRLSAARYAGCEPEQIDRTAECDPQFRKWLGQAEVQTEIDSLRVIRTQGKNWRAAVWILERVYPERYAPRKNVAAASRRAEAKLDPCSPPLTRGDDDSPADDLKGRDAPAARESPPVARSAPAPRPGKFPEDSHPDRDNSSPSEARPDVKSSADPTATERVELAELNAQHLQRDAAATKERRDAVVAKIRRLLESPQYDPHEVRRLIAILQSTGPP